MDKTKLVSIIIPCYNDWQFVEQAVDSVLKQTYSNIEIIVVDDGSDSETKTVLKRIEPKITKLIAQENQGQSVARNVGIQESKGQYILTLDSDDFFETTSYSFKDRIRAIFKKQKCITTNYFYLGVFGNYFHGFFTKGSFKKIIAI